jgi:DNA polymerase III delta prime subunit
VQRFDEGPQPLQSSTSLMHVFDDHRGQLLILGAPGGGKTTLLLELARDLLNRAEDDEGQLIPVVFNLSSWAQDRRPLDEWMVEELHLRSDAPRKLAREWVKDEQILPLLDGLDEVAQEHRAQCAAAINSYRKDHGWVPIVVCSRIAEYEALEEALALPAAVVVQPLRRQQIQEYLDRAGDALNGVRTVMQSAPHLWEMLETPLMLSVVVLAYQNRSDLPATLGEQQVFRQYVDAMFRRRARELRYAEADMRAWLHWLAANLVERAQSIFFLEDVVPEWFLGRRTARWVNVVMVAIVTMLSSLWICLVMALGNWFSGSGDDVWILAVFSAPVAALLGVMHGRDSGPVDALRLRFPGWRHLLGSAVRGAALGFAAGGALGYAGCQYISNGLSGDFVGFAEAAEVSLGYAIVVGMTLGGVFAARALLTAKMLGQRGQPGALVKRSARSSLLTLGISVAITVPFAGGSIVSDATTLEYWLASVRISLQLLGWAGLFLALDRGGYFLIRHYLARALLWVTRRAPWRYTTFLDVAAERLLMRKVGGGYIFVHRSLLEYLARVSRTVAAPVRGSLTVG